jgi:uncharacterized protein
VKPLFADAFYFVACLNRADQHHGKAVAFAAAYTGKILTTWCVLTETADALAASNTRQKTWTFITALELDPAIIIASQRDDLLRRGLRRYGERPDKSWTLTDCVSFVVMEDYGIVDALTGDHHFEQAGFRALLK